MDALSPLPFPRVLSLACVCLMKLLKHCLLTFTHGRPGHSSILIEKFLSGKSGQKAVLGVFARGLAGGAKW